MSDDPIMDATVGKPGKTATEQHIKDATYKLPEAPASATVKVYIDDFNTMITMRGTEVKDIVKQIEFIIEYAKKKGWKSTWDKGEAPQTGAKKSSYTAKPTDPDAPQCPTHNRPMRKFNGKFGEFYKCTAKLGDNEWCNEKVNIKE